MTNTTSGRPLESHEQHMNNAMEMSEGFHKVRAWVFGEYLHGGHILAAH